MNVDVTLLKTNRSSSINLNSNVVIPEEYLKNSDILELKDLYLTGYLENISEKLNLKATLSGVMVLRDAISLDAINHEFTIELDEDIEDFYEKSTNILDITEILWQNIILEVPLKLTNVSNFDEYHGDGWRLISEDSIKNTNNPFKELEDMLREE